jgi:hypothetical protein
MVASSILRVTLTASLLLASAAPAQPLLFRTYVASFGVDTNPCTLQAPCRLLPAALGAVADGGEIWMLDSANYNITPVNIGKSVTILAVPGAVGSIVSQYNSPAVEIEFDNLKVTLRNVVIGPVVGAGPSPGGVVLSGASDLTIEDSVIEDLPYLGVGVSSGGRLKISNSTLRNIGFFAVNLGNGASADICGSRLLKSGAAAVYAAGYTGTTTVSISDSIISSGGQGVMAAASSGGAARIAITRSTITRTGTALLCTGGGDNAIYVGDSLVAENNSAWSASDCTIYTARNNQFNANGSSTGALTPLALQ